MRYLLTEFRVAIVMIVAATCIPLAWSGWDSARRAELAQTRYAACVTHHDLDSCEMWRPAVVNASTSMLCEMRFDSRQCQRLMEGR